MEAVLQDKTKTSVDVPIKKKTNLDFLDLLKYILSFLVVAIHSNLFLENLFPWLEIAVPLFFVISSFLFFRKLQTCPKEVQSKVLLKYLVRNIILYFAWLLILLPITIHWNRDWWTGSVPELIKYSIKSLFFGSTFPASWYIMASIIAMPILYFTRNLNKIVLTLVFSFVYLFCSWWSAYCDIIFTAEKFILWLQINFLRPHLSFNLCFIIALPWMFLGEMFAKFDNDRDLDKTKWTILIILAVSCGILLSLESKMIRELTGVIDAKHLMLPPFVACLFSISRNIKIELKNPKLLREISTITYVLHYSLIVNFRFILSPVVSSARMLQFILFFIALIICHGVSIGLYYAEKTRYGKFLKYIH